MNQNEQKSTENNILKDELKESLLDKSNIETKVNEVVDIANKLSGTIESIAQWSESTAQLFYLEIIRNIKVTKRFLFCQLIFIPLLILFIFSTFICIGLVSYSLSNNLYIGIAAFLISMGVILGLISYWQKHLMRFLGFKETLSQLQEVKDVIVNASK